MQIEKILSEVNVAWDCGSFSTRKDHVEELIELFGEEVRKEDVVIYYDYMDDDLSEEDKERLIKWLYDDLDGGWNRVKDEMSKLGYECVNEFQFDGSGNGLYYGIEVFRKI